MDEFQCTLCDDGYYLLYKYSDCLSYEEVEDDDSLAFLDDKQVKYCEDLISHCEDC